MADMTIESTNLVDLRRRASELASAVQSLAALFEEGSVRLRRRDQVSRLKALRSAILQEVERARHREMAASTGYSLASVVPSLIRLGVGLVAATSQDQTARWISRAVLTGSQDREPSFGTVLVRVGSMGLPEDVAVVCVSRLARETKRDELAVMEGLRKQGYELLSESTFTTLIDEVMEKILKGELELPLPAQKLPNIVIPLTKSALAGKKEQQGMTGGEWLAVRRPTLPPPG